jgi:CHAT domain-containing protein/tetratricopeptide (TPR) repeat protein
MLQVLSQSLSRKLFLVPLLSMITLPMAVRTQAAQDPAVLQKQAIERIQRCTTQIRKTGSLQSVLEEMRRAEDELSRSYQEFLKRQDKAAAALSLFKLADLQRLQFRWQQAQDLYRQAYDLARQAGHKGYQVKTLIGQARVASNGLKDYNTAVSLLDEALRLDGPGVEKRDLFDVYDLKGAALSSRNEIAAAFDYANRAFSIASETNDPELLFYAYFGRGGVYQSLGLGCDEKSSARVCIEALDHAKSDLEESMSLAKKNGYDFFVQPLTKMLTANRWKRTLMELNGGHSQRMSGIDIFSPVRPSDVVVSESFIDEPHPLPPVFQTLLRGEIQQFGEETAVGLLAQARMLYGQGQVEAAVKTYLKAVDRLEAERSKVSTESSRSASLENLMQIYYEPALVLLQQHRPAEAFEVLEKSRSRVLTDLLQTQDLKLSQPADRAFYAESVKLNARISQLQRDLLNLRSTGNQNAAALAAKEKEIQTLEGEYQKLTASVVASGSKLQELIASKPVTLSSLQQVLKRDGSEVLSYLVQGSQIVLMHISGDAVHARSVVLIREHLVKKVTALRRSLRDPNEKFDEKSARELFLFLIQPALDWIKSDRLVIVPHDDLNYIPFQALIAPDGRALGERFSISYAPSATVLMRLKKSENLRAGRLLAVADPSIVEAVREVTAIGNLYPQKSRIISNALIKESDLKAVVGSYDLIHCSVHGKFVTQEPLLSHLKLEPGPNDDGQLTAAEMFGLPLANARLVVLSACDTGQAQTTRAGEVIGMVRALLYAGANSIVLSAWEVDAASTALWMETFYREAQTKTPVEAARLALIAVKKDPRYAHPYFWSPFLLIGR